MTFPPKSRYFVRLAYKGTNFHGWQIQPNANTIQAEINSAITTVLKERIEVAGAGRTDTGVHALKFYAHFDSVSHDLAHNQKLIFQLNGLLPKDIVVNDILKVREDAHARFDALSRTYEYHIHQEKDPFLEGASFFSPGNLDIEKLNRGAEILFEYSDFTSFSKANTDMKTANCRIMEAVWAKTGNRIVFTIKADRFLRNMVRAIVGTLLDAGSDKICLSEIRRIIELKDRSAAGTSVPAHGLYLVDIDYPTDIFFQVTR